MNIVFPQSPIVDDRGNLSLEWQDFFQNPQYLTLILGTALDVTNGGTGIVAGTSGGILAFIGPTTTVSSALLTNHALVIGGGAGAAPSTPVALGTNVQVLHGNATGNPTWGLVSLTSDVAGVLPLANFDSSTLVPYTGATGNVNLGANSLTATTVNATTVAATNVNATDVTTSDVAALIKSGVALTDASAASVGTLNNAPSAGNPTKWIQINDNGTVRKIPTWL